MPARRIVVLPPELDEDLRIEGCRAARFRLRSKETQRRTVKHQARKQGGLRWEVGLQELLNAL